MEFTQSANTLFKFMDKDIFLLEILKNKAFIPRYNDEDITYLDYGDNKLISIPMVCFCDIRLNKIDRHLEFYSNEGGYGIGLSKEWGIRNGIQPLQYVNTYGTLCLQLKEIFNVALKDSVSKNDETVKYRDYLINNLIYLKPISGIMTRGNEVVEKNFHDEHEWRFIPQSKENIIRLLIGDEIKNKKDYYNNMLRSKEIYGSIWLEFQYSDVKYIIVPNEDKQDAVINFIQKELDIEMNAKIKLASKIITFTSIKGDV